MLWNVCVAFILFYADNMHHHSHAHVGLVSELIKDISKMLPLLVRYSGVRTRVLLDQKIEKPCAGDIFSHSFSLRLYFATNLSQYVPLIVVDFLVMHL